MAWRLAGSLDKFRNQVNANWPNRSRVSDGTIGDAAHASGPSDHNPNPQGVVCAFDLTHDPASGLDAHALADRLISTNRNPNLKYVISNSRIAGAWSNWKWQAYNGSNPHNKHIHVSVGSGSDGLSTGPYDGQEDWDININGATVMKPTAQDVSNIVGEVWGIPANANNIRDYTGLDWGAFIYHILRNDGPWQQRKNYWTSIEQQLAAQRQAFDVANAALAQANTNVAKLRAQIDALGSRPTAEELAKLTEAAKKAETHAAEAQANYDKVNEELEKLKAQQAANEQAGRNFLQILGDFVRQYFTKG